MHPDDRRRPRENLPGPVSNSRLTRKGLAGLLLLFAHALAGACLWAGDLEQATSPDGRSVLLIEHEESTWIEDEHGLRRLDLPSTAWVNRLELLADGWVAGGSDNLSSGLELFLVASHAGEIALVELPPNPFRLARGGAVPLVENGSLVGVAWLEGRNTTARSVMAAAWKGSGWGSAERIAAAAEQQALSGAVLADGSWLLAWSRGESQGSRSMWSRRTATGQWSPPRALHADHADFDITPKIVDTPNGALASSSRFDNGRYYLVVSRLVLNRWVEIFVEEQDGTLYPRFLRGENGVRLLYRTVVPGGWRLLDLTFSGSIARRTWIERELRQRPAVEVGDQAALFRWPEQQSGRPNDVSTATWEERP